jgi:DNA-binding CsgD family transcriptional regulator
MDLSPTDQNRLHALMRTLLSPQSYASELAWQREAVDLVVGLTGVRCAEFVVGSDAAFRRADGTACRSDCPDRLASASGPGCLVLDAGAVAGARLVVSGQSPGGGFDAGCRASLALVQPALEEGVRRVVRARSSEGEVGRVLDHQPWPLFLADATGEEVYRNRALRMLLEAEPEGDRLLARLRAVAEALAGASTSQGRGVLGRVDLDVSLARCRVRLHPSRAERGVLGDRAGVLIAVEAPRLAFLDPGRLHREHGLSAREAEVAGYLVQGRSTKGIAGALEISPKTAAHHIQSVLRKLGVSSRTAVAPLLMGLRIAS